MLASQCRQITSLIKSTKQHVTFLDTIPLQLRLPADVWGQTTSGPTRQRAICSYVYRCNCRGSRQVFFLHLLMQPHQTSFLKYISTQPASTTHLNISCNPYPSTKHTLRCSQGGNSFTYLTEQTLPKISLSHVIILCYQNT